MALNLTIRALTTDEISALQSTIGKANKLQEELREYNELLDSAIDATGKQIITRENLLAMPEDKQCFWFGLDITENDDATVIKRRLRTALIARKLDAEFGRVTGGQMAVKVIVLDEVAYEAEKAERAARYAAQKLAAANGESTGDAPKKRGRKTNAERAAIAAREAEMAANNGKATDAATQEPQEADDSDDEELADVPDDEADDSDNGLVELSPAQEESKAVQAALTGKRGRK